jgi:hypothetical protein
MTEAFAVLYDLRDPAAWQQAHEQLNEWGREQAEIHSLDADHVALLYRPAGDRLRAWDRGEGCR